MNIRESDGLVVGSVGAPEPVNPQRYEVSLRYLHRNWADIHQLRESELEDLRDHIFIIQRTGALAGNNVQKISHKKIMGHPKLKNIYPTGVQLGETLKVRLSKKSRMYMAYDDNEKTFVRKVYLICIDTKHKIDPS